MTRIRNLSASLSLLASITVGFALFTFAGCKVQGTGTVNNPLLVTCGDPFQLVVAVEDACTGADVAADASISLVPVATSDQSPLPPAPTVEGTPNDGVLSVAPVTACTVFYDGVVSAVGYESFVIEGITAVARYAEVQLTPVGGCPEPLICDDCGECPACQAFPVGVTLDACLAGAGIDVNPTVALIYCCNTPPIDNTDAGCDGYRATAP